MTIKERIHYATVSLRAWKLFVTHPLFTISLLARRLAFTFTRRFCGETLTSPVTGEAIFNIQSLINYWSIHACRELGEEWHPALRESVRPVVFDVGANMGQIGRLILSINPAAQIIAIEPWPEMKDFNRHAATLFPFAVGPAPGSVKLTRSRGGWTASTSPDFYDGITMEAKMVTLDSLWQQLNCPEVDILKIDVDGAEADVLAGAGGILKHTSTIIVEALSPEARSALPSGFSWRTHNGCDWIGQRHVVSGGPKANP